MGATREWYSPLEKIANRKVTSAAIRTGVTAEKAVSDLGGKRVELSAQCRVAEFYKKQGYMELNDIHMDEDCPHTWMRKEV